MQQPAITLTVQRGPQRGQRFSLAKANITIGRVVGSDVVISDPEVSRRHASITWEREQPVIRDLDSTNGTFVNGVRLTGSRVLRDGDIIGLGEVQLAFQCPALARPAPPSPAYAPPSEVGEEPEGLSWLALGFFGLAVVVLLVVAAVGAWLITRPSEEVAGVPTVVINSPPSGGQVQMGQEVIVQATATDSRGVTRVELWVNGILYHSDVSPNPQGQSPFISRQSWTAPSAGTYTLMVKAYNAAEGVSQPETITVNVAGAATTGPGTPTATWTPTPAPTVCTLDAAFLADVTVPDGTVFEPGARIDKIWRIRNSSSCPWESGYTWVFVSGDQMGAPAFQAVPATAVGGNVDIGVTMYAPSAPGTYTGYWRMKSPDGEIFGHTCSVQIVVPEPATATPTVTVIPTETATPTATPIPTETATPTATPILTATPTQTLLPSPIIEFTVDDDSITVGDCTTLKVHIENVQAAYLSGAEYADSPVAGPYWSGSTCPTSTTTYTLHVIKLDGSTEDKQLTVDVASATPSTPTQLSPADGAVFNVYPRTVTFQWSAVSGTDVTYGIEIQAWIPSVPGPGGSWESYRSQTGLTSPTYTMDDFIGAQPGRWRVWAHNASGDSPKSGWWEFEFTQ